tara:strand:+ start:3232 stop:3807 length:576 start_codon:yes stop_codon:yes gene_type:complete
MMGFVKSNIHMNAFTALDIVIAAYVIEKTTTSAVSSAFVVSARRAFAAAVPASSSPSLARTHERARATRRPNVTLRARSCATRARAFVRRAVVGVARRARAVVSRERDDDENARAARVDGGCARARMCSAKSRRSFVRASRDTAVKSSRARRIRVIHRHVVSCNVGGGVSRAAGVSVFFFTFTALHHEWCG